MSAITYAHISPRPTESESLDIQRNELAQFCDSRGWTVAAHFRDDRLSGSELMRPGIQDAVKSLRTGDRLVVRDLSRFARDVSVALALETKLRRIGAYLVTMDAGTVLDPTADALEYHDAILPRFVKYWSDARERLVKNARTAQRMREHQSNGRKMGGHAPFGWQIAGDTLVENPHEQAAIAQALQLRNRGLSYGAIAARLGSEGFEPRGASWHAETVRRLLSDS